MNNDDFCKKVINIKEKFEASVFSVNENEDVIKRRIKGWKAENSGHCFVISPQTSCIDGGSYSLYYEGDRFKLRWNYGKSGKGVKGEIDEENYKRLVEVCSKEWNGDFKGKKNNFGKVKNQERNGAKEGVDINIAFLSDEDANDERKIKDFCQSLKLWHSNYYPKFKDVAERVYNETAEEIIMKLNMAKYKTFLEINHNIILHGAPGTGKTHLAKDVAKQLIFGEDEILIDKTDEELGNDSEKIEKRNKQETQFKEQFDFVQFHQSYDYTDFVEGLRPVQNGSDIGFKRMDGVFKKFCSEALSSDGLDNAFNALVEKIKEKKLESFNQKTGAPILIKEVDNQKNIILQSENQAKKNDSRIEYKITKENIRKILEKYSTPKALEEIGTINEDIRNCISSEDSSSAWINGSAYWAVAKYLANEIQKKYIFVVDEINRGEMSKIFGELFYSIDPGYRGKDGAIKTQYANLQKEPNKFDKALGIENKNENKGNYGHFFVPENVYIIGTMNDIDRSVESMDFAMRRRFAFKEITAKDTQKSMFGDGTKWKNGNDEKIDVSSCLGDIENRMNNLNKAILNKEFNLGQAYQIGGAYFLKFANYYKTDDNKKAAESQAEAYGSLWENHLECVIREYLRGMDNVEGKGGKLEKLKDAYNYEVIYKDDGTIDTNAKSGHVDEEDGQSEETDV